jgi:hypothetical protein
VLLRTAFFWAITQREVVTTYRRFGKTYRSHLQEESSSSHLAAEASNRPHVMFMFLLVCCCCYCCCFSFQRKIYYLTLGRPKWVIHYPMSQHFNKFMRLNADNSFMLSVFLNCVYLLYSQHVNNILIVSKTITKICARVTTYPVSGLRVGIAFIRQKPSWNIL